MDNIKAPDRLNYTVKANKLIERIDADDYLGLGKNHITRSELFLFAMALGVECNTETSLTNIYSGGLVLDKSIDSKTRAAIYAQFISKLTDPSKNVDEVTDKTQVYKMAEQYANTGFEILDEYMNTKKPFDAALDMFVELDEQYSSFNI